MAKALFWECPECEYAQPKPEVHTSTSLVRCEQCGEKTAALAIIAGYYDVPCREGTRARNSEDETGMGGNG